MAHHWSLPSSSGLQRIAGTTLRRGLSDEGREWVLMDITISGEFWPRDVQNRRSDAVEDFHVRLPQVVVSGDALVGLCIALNAWLDDPQDLDFDLGATTEQRLAVSLGVRADYICSIDRPACTIKYAAEGMLSGEWAFVVDQSCIRLWKQGLMRTARSISEMSLT